MATTSIGSSGVTFPDSSTQASSSGVAKAWVNYKGTSTRAINASYNISSVTFNATGDYTLNFTNAFADANYCSTFGASAQSGVNSLVGAISLDTAPTASALRFQTKQMNTAANTDATVATVAIFR